MNINKKFKIPNLSINGKFSSSSKIILKEKLRIIHKEIDRYFKNDSSKNLHSMRIAFRRFRYVLEIYSGCYESNLFNKMLSRIKYMQDLIGKGRDLDVLESKVKDTEKLIKKKIPKYFYRQIDKEKVETKQTIKMELINFIIDKEINKLIKR